MEHMTDLFAAQDTHRHITLGHATDLAGFRQAARTLLAQQVPPADVMWHVAPCSSGQAQDLFAGSAAGLAGDVSGVSCVSVASGASSYAATRAPAQTPASTPEATSTGISTFTSSAAVAAHVAPAVSVPSEFVALCENVILHSNPNRFGLLYRLLWRLMHEPGLRHDPLDADRINAAHMAQAVRRDMHKMKAFVRFRSVQDDTFRTHPAGGPLHVAWFEPEHHIVEAVAPFFARRFTQMRWAVLTPERCMAWNGASVVFSPGAKKSDAPPADAGEALWLTYYQHIFNPARLKLKAMHKEMPRRYWHNLPEAQFITAMSASASQREASMIGSAPSAPLRRIPAFKSPLAAQQALQI
jgi:uracil-DNA glycosylase